jgi:hypothetical protein
VRGRGSRPSTFARRLEVDAGAGAAVETEDDERRLLSVNTGDEQNESHFSRGSDEGSNGEVPRTSPR